MTDGLPPRLSSLCDASAVSQLERWTREGAMASVLSTIGHGREPRVFWGTTGARGRRLAAERDVHEALILMGDWCGAIRADTTSNENTGCV